MNARKAGFISGGRREPGDKVCHDYVGLAQARPIPYTLSPARDAVSWAEMDCRQNEWSKEVSKEHLSYVALEVVLLPYIYSNTYALIAYRVLTRVQA